MSLGRSRGDWFCLFRPFYWPRWLRRAALLTLPLALPLWLVVIVAVGLFEFARNVVRPIRDFWVAPRRRRSSYYGYVPRRRPGRASPARGPMAEKEFDRERFLIAR